MIPTPKSVPLFKGSNMPVCVRAAIMVPGLTVSLYTVPVPTTELPHPMGLPQTPVCAALWVFSTAFFKR